MIINTKLISINTNNFSLILILSYLILSNYNINILIVLITYLIIKIILKINYKQNKINYKDSWLLLKVIFLNILIYY